jgi:hypothetical protein
MRLLQAGSQIRLAAPVVGLWWFSTASAQSEKAVSPFKLGRPVEPDMAGTSFGVCGGALASGQYFYHQSVSLLCKLERRSEADALSELEAVYGCAAHSVAIRAGLRAPKQRLGRICLTPAIPYGGQ